MFARAEVLMPTLSVVIPAYNEERTLSLCVQRVTSIGHAELDLEILIVDDASTDQTHASPRISRGVIPACDSCATQ